MFLMPLVLAALLRPSGWLSGARGPRAGCEGPERPLLLLSVLPDFPGERNAGSRESGKAQ